VSLPESLRGKLATPQASALLVMHVEPSSPAEKAGILLGDLLTTVQGRTLEDTADVQRLLGSLKVGDAVQAMVLRAGTPVNLSVTLTDRPAR
jgi:S1-C subfamily serine protease